MDVIEKIKKYYAMGKYKEIFDIPPLNRNTQMGVRYIPTKKNQKTKI